MKSRTKAETFFKPPDLDETMSTRRSLYHIEHQEHRQKYVKNQMNHHQQKLNKCKQEQQKQQLND
jgi:hypothetical protein